MFDFVLIFAGIIIMMGGLICIYLVALLPASYITYIRNTKKKEGKIKSIVDALFVGNLVALIVFIFVGSFFGMSQQSVIFKFFEVIFNIHIVWTELVVIIIHFLFFRKPTKPNSLMKKTRHKKAIIAILIPVAIVIILSPYLIDTYVINFTNVMGLGCGYKAVRDNVNSDGASNNATPLQERYDLFQIATVLSSNNIYEGRLSYPDFETEIKNLNNPRKYNTYHNLYLKTAAKDASVKRASLTFFRNFGTNTYIITLSTDFSNESFTIHGLADCRTPDIYIKRNVESIFNDMHLSVAQYQELQRSYAVHGNIKLRMSM